MRCLAIFVLLCFSFAHSRVTFPNSEVLQAPDLVPSNQATFKCKNACKVYADRKGDLLMVTQKGNIIATFNQFSSEKDLAPTGFLLQAGDYVLENRGEVNPQFVFYVVDSAAPNYGSPVYTPTQKMGIAYKGNPRFVTILSSLEAIWFSGFTGVYPAGYPRIFATGFDAANDGQCHAVYQARSLYNAQSSWPVIATAVLTIDLGFIGDHNVSINYHKANDPTRGAGLSTVYTSPGYVGCSFNAGQNYYSSLTQTVDRFTLDAERLDVNAVYNSIASTEGVQFNVNNKKQLFVGTDSYSEHYDRGTFEVLVSWVRQTPASSFAIQLDFGSVVDPPIPTTTKIGRSLTALNGLALVIATCLWV